MAERRRTFALILGLGLAVLAGAGAYWVATAPKRADAPLEALAVEEAYLDFGEVWETNAFVWTLPIRNISDEDVAIEEFETTCNCLGVEPKSLVIPAGQTASIRLTLDLTGSPQDTTNRDASPQNFKLPIAPRLAGFPSGQPVWVLQGQVRTGVVIKPRSIAFGEMTRGQRSDPLTVTVTPMIPIQRLDVDCDPSLASVSANRLQRKPEKFCVDVRLAKTAPSGPLKFSVAIRAVTVNGERLPPIMLPIEGTLLEDVQACPSSIPLGVVPVGKAVEENVVLRSITQVPFEIKSVEAFSPGLTVTKIENTAMDGEVFRVIQRSIRTGHQTGEIHFRVQSNGMDRNSMRIVVPITYHGSKAE